MLKRSPNQYGKYQDAVDEILNAVKVKKDAALFEYTEKFDGVKITPETIRVTKEEIEEAYTQVDEELIDVIRKALVNIRSYHEKQVRYSWFAGWKGSVSFLCTDECDAGKGCRCRPHRDDNTSGKGWKGISGNISCRK